MIKDKKLIYMLIIFGNLTIQVGKSAIIQQYVEKKFTCDVKPTIGANFCKMKV